MEHFPFWLLWKNWKDGHFGPTYLPGIVAAHYGQERQLQFSTAPPHALISWLLPSM